MIKIRVLVQVKSDFTNNLVNIIGLIDPENSRLIQHNIASLCWKKFLNNEKYSGDTTV